MPFTDPATIQDRDVLGADGGKLGKVEAVFLDAHTDKPEWAAISTGFFGRKVSLVPLSAATEDADGNLQVPFDKDQVKGSPHHEPDQALSEQDEIELFEYYGIPWGGETVTATGAPSGTSSSTSSGSRSADEQRNDTAVGGPGRDLSGRNTDEAMTRSEERLRVGTERVEAGRARLRKYIVTENVTQTVPVSHEEIRVEREPITDGNVDAATDGPAISEEEHEVVLHAERPVVGKETVPVERVRLDTETVTEQETVSDEVRKEQIDLDDASPRERADRR
jgi:uncharacterized protein (TIGR02271 family)